MVEHIRITQCYIREFSRNSNHQSPKWPGEYWPKEEAPADKAEWDKSLQKVITDKDEFITLINDPAADLYTPFKHEDAQNFFRKAMLIADHNSYHVGEIVVVRRLWGDWK